MEFLKIEIYVRSTVREKTRLPHWTMFHSQSKRGTLPQSSAPPVPVNPHYFMRSRRDVPNKAERST